MAIVNELVTRFVYEGSDQELTGWNSTLKSSIALLTSFVATMQGFSFGLASIVSDVSESLTPLVSLSNKTGIAVESLQELNFAANSVSIDFETFSDRMITFSEKIGEAFTEGSGASFDAFEKLQIPIKNTNGELRKSEDILNDVIRQFETLNLTEQEKIFLSEELGLTQDLLGLLNLTSKDLEELRKQSQIFGNVNREEIERLAEYNRSLKLLDSAFQSIKNQIAINVAPELTKLVNKFIELIKENKELINDVFKKLTSALLSITKAFIRITPVILTAAGAFIAFKLATGGLAATLAIIFSPVLILTAVIASLLIVVDDLIVAFSGGKSVIKDFIKEFTGIDITPILQDIVRHFKEVLIFVGVAAVELFSILNRTFKGLSALIGGIISLIMGDVDGFFDHFEIGLGLLNGVIVQVLDGILGIFGSSFDEMVLAVSDAFTFISEIISTATSAIGDLLEGDFTGFATKILSIFTSIFSLIGEAFVSTFSFFGEVVAKFAPELPKKIKETFQDIFKFIKDQFTLIFRRAKEIAESIIDFFGFGDDEKDSKVFKETLVKAQPITQGSVGRPQNNQVNMNVEVKQDIKTENGAALADDFNERLREQLKKAERQFKPGGR